MKKFLVCLLAIVMLVPLMAACNDGKGEESVTEDAGDLKITTPVIDLGGEEINVLCHQFGANTTSILGYTGEIMYEEEKPGAVDSAKKKVVDFIETTYNCDIVGEFAPVPASGQGGEIPNIIKNQVTSNLCDYDIYFDSFGRAAQVALEGHSLDLNTVPGIDLSKPWWDQNAVKDLSIAGKTYFACGDINNYDDQGTWCVLFNKDLKSRLGIEEDFYALARNKEWTFDKLVEICTESDATYDTNGDGQDEFDIWAFGTETYNVYVHVVGAGYKIAQKDDKDLPYLTYTSNQEATVKILGDVLDFYNGPDVMVANNYTSYPNPWEATVHKSFIEGRELFYMCGLINVASFRKMDETFGILPVPMGSEGQDRYYHTISVDNSSFMFLPTSVPEDKLEGLGTVISAIAELSREVVTPEYYDVQLKYRDSRDDESAEMLDIIFGSRTFDLGCAYNWGWIRNCYCHLNSANIVSNFDSIVRSAQVELDKMLEKFTKNADK